MKKKLLTFAVGLALLIPIFTLSSCTKEDNIAKVIIWQGQSNASDWDILNVQSLTTYVDGEIVASQKASIYFTSEPNCTSNGGMKFDVNLQKNKSGRINTIVKGDNGVEYYNEFIDVVTTDCNKLELQ